MAAGLALMGIGGRLNQKKIDEAQANPGRCAALTRAASQGMNIALVGGDQDRCAGEVGVILG